MAHVFISHAHEDVDYANTTIREIEKGGIEHWIDSEQIGLGETWRQKIDEAIQNAIALVVIMTPSAKTSEYVTYEWIFAFGLGIKVIPLIFQETELHLKMQEMNCLDFTNPKGRRWDTLIDELKTVSTDDVFVLPQTLRNAPRSIRNAAMALNSLRLDERQSALEILTSSNSPHVEAILGNALSHRMSDVRVYAAIHLIQASQFKDEQAIPALLEAMCMVNSRLGEAAGELLSKIGEPIVPHLDRYLDHTDWRVRSHVLHILSNIGGETTVSCFIRALSDSNAHVQLDAAEALEHIGTTEALAAVEEWRRQQGNG